MTFLAHKPKRHRESNKLHKDLRMLLTTYKKFIKASTLLIQIREIEPLLSFDFNNLVSSQYRTHDVEYLSIYYPALLLRQN